MAFTEDGSPQGPYKRSREGPFGGKKGRGPYQVMCRKVQGSKRLETDLAFSTSAGER
jgi:hypothetical protein